MATGNGSTSSALQSIGQPPPPSQPQSPPSKRDLASWWSKFKKTTKREQEKGNADPKPDRFKIISRYPTFAFLGRFRELDADNVDPQEILQFTSGCGGSGAPDLDSLISEHDRLLPGGSGRDGDTPRCWFPKLRGRSVTSPAEHQEQRDGYRSIRSSTFGKSKLRSSTIASPAVAEKSCPRAPWSLFTHRKLEVVEPPNGIFGVPLQVSIKYANVAISLTDGDGKSFIYGYVPIVVAKCGVFLKEKATDIEGIFRLSGSSKRIKDLQAIFNSPDRYGKGLDWTGYTVHDAANILRRYLNQLPEPIIPLEFYDRFRDPIRNHAMQAVGDTEAQAHDVGDFDQAAAIRVYQQLIKQLPPLNRQLLLYILDLLAVFASKADLNRMTSANLSAIFQPGLLSHPAHDMSPAEYRLSQDVLIFLIENQDHFLIGMTGMAADEKSVHDVQTGNAPTTPQSSKGGVVRSSSNASAAAEDVRKFGGIRRNVSVSSKHSRHSNGNAPSPAGTPHSGSTPTIGVHRSNTVPSKKSPALGSGRFNNHADSPVLASTGMTQLEVPSSPSVSAQVKPPVTAVVQSSGETITDVKAPAPIQLTPTGQDLTQQLSQAPAADVTPPKIEDKDETLSLGTLPSNTRGEAAVAPGLTTPSKERNLASLFARTPTSDNEKKDSKAPRKLRKKNIPGSTNLSAQSSSTSLGGHSG